jgi:hypothetical protein
MIADALHRAASGALILATLAGLGALGYGYAGWAGHIKDVKARVARGEDLSAAIAPRSSAASASGSLGATRHA